MCQESGQRPLCLFSLPHRRLQGGSLRKSSGLTQGQNDESRPLLSWSQGSPCTKMLPAQQQTGPCAHSLAGPPETPTDPLWPFPPGWRLHSLQLPTNLGPGRGSSPCGPLLPLLRFFWTGGLISLLVAPALLLVSWAARTSLSQSVLMSSPYGLTSGRLD